MNVEKLSAARSIAEAHSKIDTDVRQVFLLESSAEVESDQDEPIKLLEVVEGTMEVGVEPIGFAADPEHGRGYGLLIIEVSPREKEAMGSTVKFKNQVWNVTQSLLPQTVEA